MLCIYVLFATMSCLILIKQDSEKNTDKQGAAWRSGLHVWLCH